MEEFVVLIILYLVAIFFSVIEFYYGYESPNTYIIDYKWIDVGYYRNGHDLEKFTNITQYKIDIDGRLTFMDHDGILHCDISNWILLQHSDTLRSDE